MDLNILNALRGQVKEWALKVKHLIDTPVPASLVAEKAALIKSAKTIKETVEKIFGTVDELAPIQLGAIPLIAGAVGVATIAAAAAYITKWTLDYNTLIKKLIVVDQLVADGVPRDKAVETVLGAANQKSKTWADAVSSLPILALIGGGIYLLSR